MQAYKQGSEKAKTYVFSCKAVELKFYKMEAISVA